MTPDELLDEVSKAVREREASGLANPGWETLARGEISEEEARLQLVRDAGDERLLAVFKPLGRDFTDGIAARVLRGHSEAAAPGPIARLWQRLRAVWSGPGWQLRAALGAMASATAVILALVVLPQTSAGLLPSYEASFVGGDRDWRSAEPDQPNGVPELSLGSQLEWSLVPFRAVRGALEARMFVVQEGRARPWAPPFEVSPQGVVRIRGTAQGLGLSPGPCTLVVGLGRPGTVPDEPPQVSGTAVERDPSVRWFTQSVVVTDGA
jgi:hypothetical protein